VIAALIMILVIQWLAVRDSRNAVKSRELEEGAVQTTSNKEGSKLDSKRLGVSITSGEEIGEGERGRKF
jgi:hypothetical protein